jgi:hypothetical protein
MRVSSSMSVRIAVLGLSPKRAIAVCFAPTGTCHALQFKMRAQTMSHRLPRKIVGHERYHEIYDQRTFECLTCAYAETATVIPVRRKLTFGGHHVSQ